ncbi:hypothetical protein, conserved in T. vivax [Trypanosoma vivax Y486]|uniref:Uncharacterized protein n=1 Tax=Trypanosoma vivax (strain Y486) TaxID=1055687 RepID=F9WPY6_TRYVY|nr:hypothetical protein, conserved in T. vivax [Trypanosoma vivax Y486]|eukprot:CCD19613.1 hypothetical protein, conserved in T. vivax [Trypanosoma vivax Y486]
MPAALFRALVLVNCGLLPVALGMSDLERGDITIDVHVLRTQSVKAICELARQLTAADRVANDTLLLAAANASAAVQLQKAAEGRAAGARVALQAAKANATFLSTNKVQAAGNWSVSEIPAKVDALLQTLSGLRASVAKGVARVNDSYTNVLLLTAEVGKHAGRAASELWTWINHTASNGRARVINETHNDFRGAALNCTKSAAPNATAALLAASATDTGGLEFLHAYAVKHGNFLSHSTDAYRKLEQYLVAANGSLEELRAEAEAIAKVSVEAEALSAVVFFVNQIQIYQIKRLNKSMSAFNDTMKFNAETNFKFKISEYNTNFDLNEQNDKMSENVSADEGFSFKYQYRRRSRRRSESAVHWCGGYHTVLLMAVPLRAC